MQAVPIQNLLTSQPFFHTQADLISTSPKTELTHANAHVIMHSAQRTRLTLSQEVTNHNLIFPPSPTD